MLRKLQSAPPAIFADMEAVGEAGLTESLDIPEHAEAYDISSASPLFDESSEEAKGSPLAGSDYNTEREVLL